ncbi:cysteine proteinase inhibitor 12-like [Rutidosis leptorrhynchoides]|uniref:cysteine proteinase inhibitor 12-like n=1 Tax=Rutidosis leptorrhynchoides TaxID=125765 RepID=UPI003A9A4AC9
MQIQRVLQILLLLIASTLLILITTKQSSLFNTEKQDIMASVVGGLQNSTANSNDIDSIARFAVEEHNKKENAMLEFVRVIKAQEQVVAGTLHHLTLEVVHAGEKKIYEAKVWVRPWLNSKELQEFNHVGEKDAEGSRYQSVPVHDTVIQDAANHVIKTLQMRSNSLYPYELLEVVHAKAETAEGPAKYDLVLKVKRNDKEEKFKANVHKDNDEKFHVNELVQDHS